MNQARGVLFVVAGGTGGHINSAIAIGTEAEAQGFKVQYLSGSRPLDQKLYKDRNCIHLTSQALRGKGLFGLLKSIISNFTSLIYVVKLIQKNRPEAIVGAGGYVSGPVMFAGALFGVPLYILEQNSVVGLTNKILGLFSKRVFTHFKNTRGFFKTTEQKIQITGNPVRKTFYKRSFESMPHPKIRVLVFGGSLGAKKINEFVFELLKIGIEQPICIKHQLGLDQKIEQDNRQANVEYFPMNYIDNIEDEYAWADLIICRAGASSISELRLVQKPVILVPFPFATDDHQTINAESLKMEANFPVVILKDNELTNHGLLTLKNLINEKRVICRVDQKLDASSKIINQISLDL